jgi:hypothetical protein
LQKREAELSTTAAQWARLGDVHRDLVFNLAHGALAKGKLKPPRTFNEAKIADEMARKACGLDEGDSAQHALLIRINELDAGQPRPIEASVFEGELLPGASVPVLQEAVSPNEL